MQTFCEHEKPDVTFVFDCGNSSVGRASPCQGGGREFESRFPLHSFQMTNIDCDKAIDNS